VAPVTAPVADATPRTAPVTEAQQRTQVGAELARTLLVIVGGSIIIFVLYLAVLDGFTSAEVTRVYDRTFQQMRALTMPRDVSGIAEAARIIEDASGSPTLAVSAAERTKMRDVVAELRKSNRVTTPNAAKLDRCVALIAKPEVPTAPRANPGEVKQATPDAKQPPAAPKKPDVDSKQAPAVTKQPGGADTKQPPADPKQPGPDVKQPGAGGGKLGPEKPAALRKQGSRRTAKRARSAASAAALAAAAKARAAGQPKDPPAPKPNDPAAERAKLLEDCVAILDPLRQTSATEAIDLDRLRLLKDYAKDAHEHRQAFRSFWLQAAQLVLLNLLLPLLTALLGYIFGSQKS
jgi:hypothetical protein